MRTLSAEQLDALANDTTNLTCNLLCEGTGDGGVADDGSIGDAGLTSRRNWTCSLERETLRCNDTIGCGVGRAPSGLVALGHVAAPRAPIRLIPEGIKRIRGSWGSGAPTNSLRRGEGTRVPSENTG